MDDPAAADEPLPWYSADPRAVFELDAASVHAVRRRVRRSLARDPGWEPAVDRDHAAVVAACMAPRPGEGVWLTARLGELYRRLHAVGVAHSFELWAGDRLIAGVLGIVLGRAAMLETMFHALPHAGNVNLVRTLERLAADGMTLCDIQLPTPHTMRLGAREIPSEEYQQRLAEALS